MARAHYSRVRRFRIPDDALVRILEYLDPRTLFLASKLFSRIYALAMFYHSLRYMFELALSSMRDGPTPISMAPILGRLHLLTSYRVDWPQLKWTHEFRFPAPMPAHVGSSGGFIHQIRPHGGYNTLEITELPSCRTGRTPALTRRQRFTTPPFETICIDAAQGLIIGVHIFCEGGVIGVQMHIRDLWTFAKHPRAAAESYELPTSSTVPVSRANLAIVGKKMALSLEFANGKVNHLLMDWRTLGARWLDDQDIILIDDELVLAYPRRAPLLILYNVGNLAHTTIVRQYELPPGFASVSGTTRIKLHANLASRVPVPGALFFPDPANRVLVVESADGSAAQWLFIPEAYFRNAQYARRDPPVMPWAVWGQHTLLKVKQQNKTVLGPYAVGARVVFLDAEAGHRAKLSVIEFTPFPEASPRMDGSWSIVGPRAGMVPNESTRRVPSGTVEHYGVDELAVTEDNIVLFLDPQPTFQPLNILTFGAPKVK
ncbi:F-box domain-containing protein [Mycena kentingensis (nom. inval.)]|nr:F-box domain-containing protein [Mycena kentingensis (nom. inval.)]